jgi:hypothetical protein
MDDAGGAYAKRANSYAKFLNWRTGGAAIRRLADCRWFESGPGSFMTVSLATIELGGSAPVVQGEGGSSVTRHGRHGTSPELPVTR